MTARHCSFQGKGPRGQGRRPAAKPQKLPESEKPATNREPAGSRGGFIQDQNLGRRDPCKKAYVSLGARCTQCLARLNTEYLYSVLWCVRLPARTRARERLPVIVLFVLDSLHMYLTVINARQEQSED